MIYFDQILISNTECEYDLLFPHLPTSNHFPFPYHHQCQDWGHRATEPHISIAIHSCVACLWQSRPGRAHPSLDFSPGQILFIYIFKSPPHLFCPFLELQDTLLMPLPGSNVPISIWWTSDSDRKSAVEVSWNSNQTP